MCMIIFCFHRLMSRAPLSANSFPLFRRFGCYSRKNKHRLMAVSPVSGNWSEIFQGGRGHRAISYLPVYVSRTNHLRIGTQSQSRIEPLQHQELLGLLFFRYRVLMKPLKTPVIPRVLGLHRGLPSEGKPFPFGLECAVSCNMW